MQNALTKNFNLANPPPPGNADVGEFVWDLFVAARREKEIREYPRRWEDNYALYRGKHFRKSTPEAAKLQVMANLLWAYKNRTVANITSRSPTTQVRVANGLPEEMEQIDSQQPGQLQNLKKPVMSTDLMNAKVQWWWKDTEQQAALELSADIAETYGTVIERFIGRSTQFQYEGRTLYRALAPAIEPNDPFAAFPAPGNRGQPSDGAYFGIAGVMECSEARRFYKNKEVEPDREYREVLAFDREESVPSVREDVNSDVGLEAGWSTDRTPSRTEATDFSDGRCLVVEMWFRDWREKDGEYVNPGGIRMVTVTNKGKIVLADKPNPNVNPGLSRELTRNTWLFDHFPFCKAVSYRDPMSFWGLSAAEQVGQINLKIDEILSRMVGYILLKLHPVLLAPLDSGVDDDDIVNEPNLVIRPATSAQCAGFGYLEVPALGIDFFRMVELLQGFMDTLYGISDADRGEQPGSVIAASAIGMLQERGQVLMRSKINAMDELVRWRGRCAISHWQNFGWEEEIIMVNGRPARFKGVDHAQYNYIFHVDPFSTYIKSDAQIAEMAKTLFESGAIDRQAYLEAVKFPGATEILSRMALDQRSQAIQMLLDAGDITEQQAMLMMAQGKARDAGMVYDSAGAEAPMPAMPGMPTAGTARAAAPVPPQGR